MPQDEPPEKGNAKAGFNRAAPKTGHTSKEFNRQAGVRPPHLSRDVFQNKPVGTGFTPPGQKKEYKKTLNRFDSEQSRMRESRKKERDMVHLRDKFNDRSRGR